MSSCRQWRMLSHRSTVVKNPWRTTSNAKRRKQPEVSRPIWIMRWSRCPTSWRKWPRECMLCTQPKSTWQILTWREASTQDQPFHLSSGNMSSRSCPRPVCQVQPSFWVSTIWRRGCGCCLRLACTLQAVAKCPVSSLSLSFWEASSWMTTLSRTSRGPKSAISPSPS